MDRTPAGGALTTARISLFRRHVSADAQEGLLCLDVGIGGGRFMLEAPGMWNGFDVNPHAVDWIKTQGGWVDPYLQGVDVMTLWDCLEHIHDPRPLLANARQWVFTSLPIFSSAEHVLRSRHFRRDEHCWYFTRPGIIGFMARLGFECREHNAIEQACGREDIESFVFRRSETT